MRKLIEGLFGEAKEYMGLRVATHIPSNLFLWIRKGSFALADQGFFSGTNLLLNVLLARWLSSKEYGAFVVAYSIFILLQTLHLAVLIEPMMVFGPRKYRDRFRKYLAVLIYGNFGLMTVIGTIPIITTILLWYRDQVFLKHAFWGLGFSTPFILFFWLVRRAFYVSLEPQKAMFGGLLYLIGTGIVVSGLYFLGLLSAGTTFLGLGVVTFMVGLFLLKWLHPQWKPQGANPSYQMIVEDHWKYGRWALGANFLNWFPGNIYFVVIPIFVGLEGAAALRAMINLVSPIQLSTGALSFLLLPFMSKRFSERGIGGGHKVMVQLLLSIVIITVLYWLLLGLSGRFVMHTLYGGRYTEYARFLWFIGLLPVFGGLSSLIAHTLRALNRPDKIFWCCMLSAISAFAIGIPLTVFFHLKGAIAGLLISSIITCLSLIHYEVAILIRGINSG